MKLLRTFKNTIVMPGSYGLGNPLVMVENDFGGIMATDVLISVNQTTPASGGTKSEINWGTGMSVAELVAGAAGALYFHHQSSSSLDLSQELNDSGGTQLLSLVASSMNAAAKPLIFGACRFYLDHDRTAGEFDIVTQFYNRYVEAR